MSFVISPFSEDELSLTHLEQFVTGSGKKKDHTVHCPASRWLLLRRLAQKWPSIMSANLPCLMNIVRQPKVSILALGPSSRRRWQKILEWMVKAGLVRAGPVEGFLATTYPINGRESIILF